MPKEVVVAVVEVALEAETNELPPSDKVPMLWEYTDSLYEAPQAIPLLPPQPWLHSDAKRGSAEMAVLEHQHCTPYSRPKYRYAEHLVWHRAGVILLSLKKASGSDLGEPESA